ncbi:MAG: hypothetical protein K8T26_09205 [Lentisphaerae bacterium]|nr:hypothetical protein [Lentisphaerota bacterium]
MPSAMLSVDLRRVTQPALTVFLTILGGGTLFLLGAGLPSHRPMNGYRLAPPPAATAAPIRSANPGRLAPTLPRYPAISRVATQSAELNGVPVQTQTFHCSDPAADVMDYYLSQLASRGWEDQTEAFFKITPCLGDRTLDPRQQQDLAEKYDFTRSTQAVLVKPNESINITIEPQSGGGSKVNLSWAGTSDLVSFWRKVLQPSAAPAKPQQWFQAVTRSGPQPGRMQFFRSTDTPDAMIATLAARMQRAGWTPQLPAANSATGDKTCLFVQGDRWAFATARTVRPGETSAVLAEQ